MLMSLGRFVWGVNTLAYQQLQRQTQYRYANNNRVGKRASTQFLGPGNDTITLPGWISPELAGQHVSLTALRFMAGSGKPFVLVSGTGELFGLWEIRSITETQSTFWPNGRPRKIDFSVSLHRVEQEHIHRASLITNVEDVVT